MPLGSRRRANRRRSSTDATLFSRRLLASSSNRRNRIVERSVSSTFIAAEPTANELAAGSPRLVPHDPAGGQLDRPRQPHVIEQRAVVGDEEERAVESVECHLELLDR